MIYLDWAATAKPDSKAVSAAFESYQYHFGNASSIHSIGTDAAALIQQSRYQIASHLNVNRERLHFCSSGTEANNIIISSYLKSQSPGSLILSPVEHPSIEKPIQELKQSGWRIIYLPIKANGIIDDSQLLSLIREDTRALFLMGVNNENGAIQPVSSVCKKIEQVNETRNRKIKIHLDLVQALGKIPLKMNQWDVDSASFSGHKIGAIRGSGLLYLKQAITPLYQGGGQEKGMRSGTENNAAIISLSVALKNILEAFEITQLKVQGFKQQVVEYLSDLNINLLPINDKEKLLNQNYFSPYILQFSIPPLPSEVIVRLFNDHKIAISGGSACSSNSREKAGRISKAIGIIPRLVDSAVRISFGKETTQQDIDQFLKILKDEIWVVAKKFQTD